MAKDLRTHYLVEFASRYAGSRFKTLTAGAALWRAETLVDDAEMFLKFKKDAEDKELQFGRRASTYEIISYYVVGLVTCLEWHARSRLVDLLVFRPNSIEASDVKNIATLAISPEYLQVFDRLYGALNIGNDLRGELRKIKSTVHSYLSEEDDGTLHYAIDHIFKARNHLVHEIDLSIIGHFSIRDMPTLDDAIDFGRAVVTCIRHIEAIITKNAPSDFPNRLGKDGGPEDEIEKLTQRISELEAELRTKFEENSDGPEFWTEAVAACQSARGKEFAFIDQAVFLRPVRHLDMRHSFQIEVLKSRVAFLLMLKSEVALY
jgi:hypothetical protein